MTFFYLSHSLPSSRHDQITLINVFFYITTIIIINSTNKTLSHSRPSEILLPEVYHSLLHYTFFKSNQSCSRFQHKTSTVLTSRQLVRLAKLGLFHTSVFCRPVPGTVVCGRHRALLGALAVSSAGSLFQHQFRCLSQLSAPVSLDDGGHHKESNICSLDEQGHQKK